MPNKIYVPSSLVLDQLKTTYI